MGADKGVHVVDDAIAGSDALATSRVLAAAIEKIGSGGQASTWWSAAWPRPTPRCRVVPAMLAERLDLPQVTLGSVVESQGETSSGSSATVTPPPR